MNNKIAIVGASYLQRPLVEKAIQMGLETHVFAWEDGEQVSDIAHEFYPISILDKKGILIKCKELEIIGIISIASDIAMPTVNYIAHKLGLIGNSIQSTINSTNKYKMRRVLNKAGLPCPKFQLFDKNSYDDNEILSFPVIVKPVDRSGSRGITKVNKRSDIDLALKNALNVSLSGKAIVEEFIDGIKELSVEMISFKGEHYFLALTDKVTTGEPHYVEIEHHQPADVSDLLKQKIIDMVKDALDAFNLNNGASHTEVMITRDGNVHIIELAGRMGGDFIGSSMVELSTGYDFVRGVIEISIGTFNPVYVSDFINAYSGVYYILAKAGTVTQIINNSISFNNINDVIPLVKLGDHVNELIDGSAKRAGVFIYSSATKKSIYNPQEILNIITK